MVEVMVEEHLVVDMVVHLVEDMVDHLVVDMVDLLEEELDMVAHQEAEVDMVDLQEEELDTVVHREAEVDMEVENLQVENPLVESHRAAMEVVLVDTEC